MSDRHPMTDETLESEPTLSADEYQRGLSPEQRRVGGVHYTPAAVAGDVTDIAMAALTRTPASVLDPSCGAGVFLLAVAERLVERGLSPELIATDVLAGVDIDEAAVRITRQAISSWAARHGASVGPDEIRVLHGDALLLEPDCWPGRPSGGFDLVIGNPPFLGQLDSRTARDSARRSSLRERFPEMGAYTDDAALFLAAAARGLAPGGVVALIQPQSMLSARDSAILRRSLLAICDLVSVWTHTGTPFPDASVRVCAPVLRRRFERDRAPAGPASVEVRSVSLDGDRSWVATLDRTATEWAGLLAEGYGVPWVGEPEATAVGEVATATAGFRDEFYALCDAMVDLRDGATELGPSATAGSDEPKLITVGMVDPFTSRWGLGTYRFGGKKVSHPVLDRDRLHAESPRVARWVNDRLRPKVLVATQTKVVECVVDPAGDMVPVTPTISVEPVDGLVDEWFLGAAISAPPVAAMLARSRLGTGLSSGSFRWTARGLLQAPLPIVAERWTTGARIAERIQNLAADAPARVPLIEEFAAVMTTAYGLGPDHPVVGWWLSRLPRR